jgi:hypothetical protein
MTNTDDVGTTISTDVAPAPIRAGLSKSATVQKLLSRGKGATLAEIMTATHWRPHSCRAFLTGLRKREWRSSRRPAPTAIPAGGSSADGDDRVSTCGAGEMVAGPASRGVAPTLWGTSASPQPSYSGYD